MARKLHKRWIEMLAYREIHGKTHREIAAIYGISEPRVSQILQQAYRRLRA